MQAHPGRTAPAIRNGHGDGSAQSMVVPGYRSASNSNALYARLRPVLDAIVIPRELILVDDASGRDHRRDARWYEADRACA